MVFAISGFFLGFYFSKFLSALCPIPFFVLLGFYPSPYLPVCRCCSLTDLLGGSQTNSGSALFCSLPALKSSSLVISCFEF